MSQTPDNEGDGAHMTVARISARETTVTRSFDASARLVFAAWSQAELFRQWWVPRSFGLTLLTCEMDVRPGGSYRLEFGHPASDQPMAFFGRYIDVTPYSRLSWTNEESSDGPVTTVTFEEMEGRTRVVIHNLYPSEEALDAEIASGATSGTRETLDQLQEFLSAQV